MVSGELAGLGFMIATEAGPYRAPQPQPGGASKHPFWIDPAKSVAGVILIQLIPFADAKSLPLLDDFERAVYAIWS